MTTVATPPNTTEQNPIERVKGWLTSDPRNLMLGLVFAASLAQPRQDGRNAFQTLVQRGLGTAMLGGEMERNKLALAQQQAEGQRKQQETDSEAAYRQEIITNQQAQLEAENANAAARQAQALEIAKIGSADAAAQRALQLEIAKMDNATRAQIARLTAGDGKKDDNGFQSIFNAVLDGEIKRAATLGEPMNLENVRQAMLQLFSPQPTNPPGAPQPLPGTPAPPPAALDTLEAITKSREAQATKKTAAKKKEADIQAELAKISQINDLGELVKVRRERGIEMSPTAREAIARRIQQLSIEENKKTLTRLGH